MLVATEILVSLRAFGCCCRTTAQELAGALAYLHSQHHCMVTSKDAIFSLQQLDYACCTTKCAAHTASACCYRTTAQEIAGALAYLHSQDLLHGDLTGGNILLASSDSDERGFCAKVADFGLSRTLGSEPVDTGTYGTVTHMPPELLTTG